MEGKKQETDEKEKHGFLAEREETSGQVANEEFLGVKLRRRINTGVHTPVPAWKDLMAGEDGRRSNVSASARQLGASLWEIQNLEMKNSSLSGRRRHGKGAQDEMAMDDRPKSSASFRHSSLLENYRNKEKTSRAQLPESSPSYSSSIGAAVVDHALTPSCSSEIIRPSHRDSRYGLKTSTELLKVLNRIWALEEQQTSNVSLVKSLKLELHQAHSQIKEMEGLIQKVSDEKLIKRSKEKEKAKLKLEEERRVRKNSENLQRKLGKELNELKSAFLKAVKDLEKEKRVNSLLEDLCDEFAKGTRDYEEEVRVLKQGVNNNSDGNNNKDYGRKFDRVILHISEAWLDERMQMQIAEKRGDLIEKSAIVQRLCGEIKTFLREKASCSKQEENVISGNNRNFRRQSLESVHLNGTTSAPRVLEEDDEDSIATDLHCFELEMNSKNGKDKLDLNIAKILPRKTCFEDSPKTNSREIVANKVRKNNGETNFLDYTGQFRENANSGEIYKYNPEISEFTPELPPGVRENTLKAKLIQARLEGRQVRLMGSLRK